MQAFTQYLLWSKIVSQINRIGDISDPTDDARNPTSIDVRNSLNASVHKFFKDYPPKISSTMETVNEALNNITRIPDKIWPMIANQSTVTDDKLSAELDAAWDTLAGVVYALYLSMANALYGAFGINLDDDVSKKDPAAAKNIKDGGYQLLVQDKTWRRYKLVVCHFSHTRPHLAANVYLYSLHMDT